MPAIPALATQSRRIKSQGQPQIHSLIETSLDYMKPCLFFNYVYECFASMYIYHHVHAWWMSEESTGPLGTGVLVVSHHGVARN